MNSLLEHHRSVEFVDEQGTTPRGHRRPRDAAAARTIAHLPGHPVREPLPLTVTPGEIANLQRLSREGSGGRLTISRSSAHRVLQGEMTLAEAVAEAMARPGRSPPATRGGPPRGTPLIRREVGGTWRSPRRSRLGPAERPSRTRSPTTAPRQAGPIVARLLATDASLRPQADAVRSLVSEVVAEIRGLPPAELEDRLAALGGPQTERPKVARSEAPRLSGALGAVRGKVVLRMAPFPSGVLHIGNSRMLFVHQLYRERYDGKLLLVFDDTVGSAEKRIETEFFDLILGDCELAGVRAGRRLLQVGPDPAFYPWARRVIEKGGAYVCRCPQELLRENRVAGRACPERSQTVSETLEEWERMLGERLRPGRGRPPAEDRHGGPRPGVPRPRPPADQRPRPPSGGSEVHASGRCWSSRGPWTTSSSG